MVEFAGAPNRGSGRGTAIPATCLCVTMQR
jgi:hypothetical protein